MKYSQRCISRSLIRGILFAAVLCLLFSGSAGAVNLGTYFVYQDVSAFNLEEGEWKCGENSISITNGGIFPNGEFVAGTYERGGNTISVISPDVKYEAGAKINNADYLVQTGGIVYSGSDLSVCAISLVSDIPVEWIILYKPDGTIEHFASAEAEMKISGIGNYRIEVIFPTNAFVEGMIPVNAASKFTFKCIDINPSISASADTLYRGEAVRITVEGTPGMEYLLNVNGFEIPESQLYGPEATSTANQYALTIPSMGKVTFSAKVNTNQNLASLKLVGVKNGELEFLISSPVVTAQAAKSSFYIEDEVTILGTSSVGKTFTFSIVGNYVGETDLTDYITAQTTGKNWKVIFSTKDFVSSNGKKLDPGIYTVHVKEEGEIVASVGITLTLPFVNITNIPETVSQGETLSVVGNAEGAKTVMYYIFGENFFKSGAVRTEVTADGRTYLISLSIDNTYVVGEYNIVVQHPMFDGEFSIYPEGNKIILPPLSSSEESRELDVFARQPIIAAEVLCQELGSRNIDDTYARKTFTVIPQSEGVKPDESLILNPGWNFISVPKYLDSSCDTAGELLGSLDTDGISPLGYDAKTGWYVLKADTAIKPLDGYWVYSKGADELTLKYSTAVNTPPAKTVYKGWNAVGLSAEKPMTAKSAFSNLDWARCLPWDMELKKWGTVIVNGGSAENSEELKLELGCGHWLYVESDGTYLGNTA